MISAFELSKLLASLYAAPLEPDKWQVFFDHLSRLTKISNGYLMSDSKCKGREILAGGGFSFDPELSRLYKDRYAQIDPFWPVFLRNPRVRIIQGEELVSHDQLLKTEYYNDALAKNDMEFMTLLSCCATAGQTNIMPLWRRLQDGPMDNASIALLQMLLPHAHVALQIHAKLQAENLHDRFAELTLQTMSAAVFLVSAGGHVQYMNQLAASCIEKRDGLLLKSAVLTASNTNEDAKLKLIILAAASVSMTTSHTVPGGALTVSRQSSQRPLHLVVLPVPENRKSMVAIPCALVFVSDSTALPKSRATLMRMIYGLTPTESRFADFLLEGLTVRDVADRLGITVETARFHLKRVLAKTATHRQTELMRLMLLLPEVS